MVSTLGDRAPTDTPGFVEPGDERRLVAEAQHDRRAFAPLYARYANPIYQYCYGRLGSKEAAEDATSLVFANALGALPRYHEGSFRSWLFAIAHNVIVDHFRAARATTQLEAASAYAAPGPSLDDLALSADAVRSLRHLLSRLPQDQRRVIELRLSGLSGPEIAHVVGRNHSWVKVTQFRAIARLRTLLGVGAECEEERDATE